MDLYTLETVLQECNSPLTPSDRRRDIERMLFSYDEMEDSWTFYMHILSLPNASDYAYHLAISMLEGKVTKKWTLLKDDARLAVRSGICGLVQQVVACNSPLTRQPFFVKKLLRLCADIARNDWPHDYADFIDSVFQLCSSGDLRQAAIGFVFLRTVSEEFTDERALFTTQRRMQLRSLFEQLLPRIGELIATALHSWMLSLPDSSPNVVKRDEFGDVALEALACLAHLLTWAPLHPIFAQQQQLSLNELLFQVFANGFTVAQSTSPSDAKRRAGAQLVLSCIAELFGRQRCLPKDSVQVLQVASSLFQVVAQLVTPHLEQQRNSQDASILADNSNVLLDGITNCFATFFSTCFTPLILSNPTNREGVILTDLLVLLARYTLTQPDSDTICACLEIWGVVLEALVSTPGPTVLVGIEPSILEFAQRLLVRSMFTTNQRELDELDDGDATSMATSMNQFCGSKASPTSGPDDFDNSNCDFDGIFGDNAERDYQLAEGDGSDLPKAERFFIGVSVVIRQIAIAYPKMIIGDLLLKSTQERATFFVEITRHLVPERILNSNVRAVDASRIHCVSRDLATLVSLVAGVADLMDHPTGFSVFSSLAVLTHQSCYLVGLAQPSTNPSPLREDLIRLHSRLFASLRAVFIHIARPILIGALTTPRSTSEESCQQLTQSIVGAIEAAIQLIVMSKAPEILQASIPFLYACLTSRIPAISNCQVFTRLYTFLAADPTSETVLNLLSPTLRIQLSSGLIASHFLPHVELRDNQQNWPGRSSALSNLFSQMIAPFFNLNFINTPNGTSAPVRLKWLKNSLRLVTAVCRLVATESPQSRLLVVNCIVMGPIEHNDNNNSNNSADSGTKVPLLDTCLALLPVWQQASEVESVLALMAFLSSVVNLQAQVDGAEMDRLIQTVMDSFPPTLVCANLLAPSSEVTRQVEMYNHQLVAAFLSILRHVFEKGDFASSVIQRRNKNFLSAAIHYCLEDLRPAISANQASISSVLPALIALLETIVADNWHFFSRKFGSSSGLGQLMDDVDRLEEQHYPSLVSIVEALFSALLLPDIEVVRRAVSALNRLDTRCRLFSRHFFASSTQIITAVSTTILAALQAGAADLLRDDILILLHTILDKAQFNATEAKTGFTFFFQSILPTFANAQLLNGSSIVDELLQSLFNPAPSPPGSLLVGRLPTDQPSFTAAMARFVTDFRYYFAVHGRSSPPLPGDGWLLSAARSSGASGQQHQPPRSALTMKNN